MPFRLSIRARVLTSVFAILIVTNAALFFVLDNTYGRVQSDEVQRSLSARATLARDLANDPGMTPQALVQLLGTESTSVEVELVSGAVLGSPMPAGGQTRYVLQSITSTVNPDLNQARITVWVPNSALQERRDTLRWTLLAVQGVGLIVVILLTLAVIDIALRPLDVMANRATRITGGERGIRMNPNNPRSEVGRAATAIDLMLDELEGAEQRARQAEQVAQGSREQTQSFLSDAAHELKTPMAGIQAAAEALVQMPADAEEEREELAYLLAREANRASHLVTSLLESAHVESGPTLYTEELQLADLLFAEQRRLALARPRVKVFVDGSAPAVLGDRHAVTSILRNLADNAARAASPTGWVLLHLSQRQTADVGYAVVNVVDSGPGIPIAEAERVFDRLVRLASTATTTEGSGLGLPIARGYARAHGGEVSYISNPVPFRLPGAQGACFEVLLPVAARQVEVEELYFQPNTPASGSALTHTL